MLMQTSINAKHSQRQIEYLGVLLLLSLNKEQLPPEAKVRGSNPLGRAMHLKVHTGHMGNILFRGHR